MWKYSISTVFQSRNHEVSNLNKYNHCLHKGLHKHVVDNLQQNVLISYPAKKESCEWINRLLLNVIDKPSRAFFLFLRGLLVAQRQLQNQVYYSNTFLGSLNAVFGRSPFSSQ